MTLLMSCIACVIVSIHRVLCTASQGAHHMTCVDVTHWRVNIAGAACIMWTSVCVFLSTDVITCCCDVATVHCRIVSTPTAAPIYTAAGDISDCDVMWLLNSQAVGCCYCCCRAAGGGDRCPECTYRHLRHSSVEASIPNSGFRPSSSVF